MVDCEDSCQRDANSPISSHVIGLVTKSSEKWSVQFIDVFLVRFQRIFLRGLQFRLERGRGSSVPPRKQFRDVLQTTDLEIFRLLFDHFPVEGEEERRRREKQGSIRQTV